MTNKCSPHDWQIPRPGDMLLRCGKCTRTLARWDITPNMRASIVNSVEQRHGPAPADSFRAFFGYGPLAESFKSKTAIYALRDDPDWTVFGHELFGPHRIGEVGEYDCIGRVDASQEELAGADAQGVLCGDSKYSVELVGK